MHTDFFGQNSISNNFYLKFILMRLLFEAYFDVTRIFGSIQLLIKCNLLFPYRKILRTCLSFELPSSTPGGDIHMRSRTFWDKTQFRTTFIGSFFDETRIFGSIEPYIKYTLPFLYRKILRTCQSFELSSFTSGGDRDRYMCSRTFLDGIQFRTTFI